MNFPQTVEELLHWDVSQGHDSFGTYHIITGFEGTGGCFWCGGELSGRRKRYCKSGPHYYNVEEEVHWRQYHQHFAWSYARTWCLRRYDHHCANCGIEPRHWDRETYGLVGCELEVHHIIPLEGGDRGWSVYNVPWNLICFCHDCHQLIHAVMRELNRPAPPDLFNLAVAQGQAVFEPLRELA